METNHLRLLCDVAQLGSFAAAARRHDLDPSAVSRIIAGLEADLGVRLFQRSTRRLTLTEAGSAYLARVAGALEDLDAAGEAARALGGEPVGTLRLTASVAFGQVRLLPLLPDLRARYPRLKLDLLLTDYPLDLVGEQIDLAIRLGPGVSGDLIAVKLMDTRYRVVASAAYCAAAPPLIRPGDLAGHSCIRLPLPGFRSHWQFLGPAGGETVAVAGDLMISSVLAIRQAALDGLGVALLADWLVDADIAAGRLIALLPAHRVTATAPDTAAWLVYPSRRFMPHKVRLMIDFLTAALRPTLPPK